MESEDYRIELCRGRVLDLKLILWFMKARISL